MFGPYVPEIPEEAELSSWGIGRLQMKSDQGYHAGHKYYYPLKDVNTIDELKQYPFPDYSESGYFRGLEEQIRQAKDKQFTVIGQMSQTILETAISPSPAVTSLTIAR